METRQKHRLAGLRYFLYNRPLHPELFDIHHDHRITKANYEARIWITGVRHLIAFHHAGATVTELLADGSGMLPERGRIVSTPLRGEHNHQYADLDGIRYIASYQVERMRPRPYARVHNELASAAERRGIYVPFPDWSSTGLMPFVYVDYEARAKYLQVFVYHAFPEELTLVKTQSVFELV